MNSIEHKEYYYTIFYLEFDIDKVLKKSNSEQLHQNIT